MTYLVNGIECRTREESLKHIAQQAKTKKIGPKTEREACGCEYQYSSGNNCAVGSLFSKEQLKTIKASGHNEMSIDYLTRDFVGQRNVETVTGMKLSELKIIQDIHDGTLQNHGAQQARDGVRIYCEKELEKLNNATPKKPEILRTEEA